MSRKAHRAPFAMTCNGDLLLNVAELDGPTDIASLMKRATAQSGAVFVGVVLDEAEVAGVVRRIMGTAREAAAFVAGGRQRRRSR